MERSKWEEGQLISDEEALEMSVVLNDTAATPGWHVFLDLLKASRVNARETALAQGKEKFDYWTGYIAGLEAAGALPLLIVAQAARATERAEAKMRTPRRSAGLLRADSGDVGGF